jgi:hypothetical protein
MHMNAELRVRIHNRQHHGNLNDVFISKVY